MYDVPTASRHRRRPDPGTELARSGLLGTRPTTTARSFADLPERPSRWSREARPSDAVTAECTCPIECIRDHEHE